MQKSITTISSAQKNESEVENLTKCERKFSTAVSAASASAVVAAAATGAATAAAIAAVQVAAAANGSGSGRSKYAKGVFTL